MNETAKDFFSGCLGGIAGTIVGHPFETVKGMFCCNRDIEIFFLTKIEFKRLIPMQYLINKINMHNHLDRTYI